MNKLRSPVAALVIMSILISLSVGIYEGFKDGYGFTEQDLQEGLTIMEALEGLNLIKSANDVSNAINVIKNPSNPLDLLGGLTAAGIGVLQVIKDIIFFPTNIIAITINHVFFFILNPLSGLFVRL